MKNTFLFVVVLMLIFLQACKKSEADNPTPAETEEEVGEIDPNEANPNPRTWYVAVTGSDANDGTKDKPLQSLQKAVDTAKQGDVIELRGGTHESREIKIRRSNLTIRSYPGEWAVIKAVTNVEDITSVLWYREPRVKGGLLENLEIVGGYFYGIKLENNWENNLR